MKQSCKLALVKSKEDISNWFKLKAIGESKVTSNREAARHHGIDESVVRQWKKNFKQLEETKQKIIDRVDQGRNSVTRFQKYGSSRNEFL